MQRRGVAVGIHERSPGHQCCGRHAFTNRLKELGVDPATIDVQKAFAAFKALCDKKKIVYDDDILALANEERRTADTYELVDLQVTSATGSDPHAAVTLRVAGAERRAEATGDGMVDACYKAIYKITGMTPTLERYSVKAITGGTDALGEVSCLVRENGVTVAGQGAHSDIVMASALALVNALNRLNARLNMPVKRASDGPSSASATSRSARSISAAARSNGSGGTSSSTARSNGFSSAARAASRPGAHSQRSSTSSKPR